MTWTTVSTPFDDGFIQSFCYSPDLSRVLAMGRNGDGSIGVATSDNFGLTWTSRGNPFNVGAAFPFATCTGAAWSSSLSMFVMGGFSFGSPYYVLTHSADGITWSVPTSNFGTNGQCQRVTWSDSQATFVASGNAIFGTGNMFSSTNGTAWTNRTGLYTPAANAMTVVHPVKYIDSLSLWVAAGETSGSGGSGLVVATSTGLVTWTARLTLTAGSVAHDFTDFSGLLVFVGNKGDAVTYKCFTSTDASSFTERISTPFYSPSFSQPICVEDANGTLLSGASNFGAGHVLARSDDAINWGADCSTPFENGNIQAALYHADFGYTLLGGASNPVGVSCVYGSPEWCPVVPQIYKLVVPTPS